MSKRSAGIVAAVVLAACLTACATATPYQPNIRGQQTSGGYSEVRIEPNRYRVNFAGNSLTSRETVEAYLLFRAAELTVQQGSDWFSIQNRNTDRNVRTIVQPDPFYNPWWGPSFGGWSPSWRYYGGGFGWRSWDPFWGGPFWASNVDIRTIDRFEASAEIVLSKGAKPQGDPSAFDAHAVIESLKPRIQFPAPPKG